MNLFWSTRSLTQQREDHLTEFLAAALDADEEFRDAYAEILLARLPGGPKGSLPKIKEIQTQPAFPGTGCRPDLLLFLEDGRRLLAEHKLEAAETLGSGETAAETSSQLARYLDLNVDGVAFVRASWASIDPRVLADSRYIRPESGEHFLWRDLYPALRRGSHEITRWLAKGFERLGFTPPIASIGDLADPDEEVRLANQKNFGKLWDSTRSLAQGQGWKVQAGHYCELYLTNNANSDAELIYISPLAQGGGLLRFRVTPKADDSVQQLRERLEGVADGATLPVEVEVLQVRRADGLRAVVDVRVSLRDLLGREEDARVLESRLREYVRPLLEEIS